MPGQKRRFDWAVLHPTPGVEAPSATPPVPLSDGAAMEVLSQPATDAVRPSVAAATDDDAQGASFPLRVNDLKQYAYCPRIVFYQYAMPVQRKATFKMEHGKGVEAKVEQLERRRKLREYGLADGERRFQVSLTSRALGLSGRLDLMITTPRGVFPVDFKDTREPVRHNHHIQLCAYAFLIEETFGRPVSVGFIYRVPRDDVVVIEITAELRAETRQVITEIRRMIAGERMPSPTPVRARCEDCEYRNYCGDVF